MSETHYSFMARITDKPPGLPITVIITCHNYGKYLAECLQSILSQNKTADRVILVDDASTDDTARIARGFPTVEYLYTEFRDVCAARNYALKSVTTPWVLYVDADNWLHHRYLDFLWQAAQTCPDDVGALYASKNIFGKYLDAAYAGPYDEKRLDNENYIDMCALIRTSALRMAGGWPGPMQDERGPTHDDWAMWLKLRSLGWKFQPVPNAVLQYRCHESNFSALGGDQAPNTLLRHARHTILTVLSGRRWNLGRYFDWLETMECHPASTEIFLVDNSGDESFSQEIRIRMATQRRFSSMRYIAIPDRCDPTGKMTNEEYAKGGIEERLQRDKNIHEHVARIYGRAFSLISGDYVLCVEDDVIPPKDVLLRLIRGLAWDRNVGAVGGVVMSRLHPHQIIAGYSFSDAAAVPPNMSTKTIEWRQMVQAGFVSAGCVLYRVRALRHVRPRYEERPEGTLFWDISVGLDMRAAGYTTKLDGGCQTRHYQPDGSYV